MEAAGESPAEISMGFVEILLIILGVVAFVGSFVIPENLVKDGTGNIQIPQEQIKELVNNEVKQATFQIEEKVDETITAATQKTERYMERMSNEKIMAIEEYSSTVLEQIHKNHEEAVFLYDMLNNKYAQVKNTAAEIGIKVQKIKKDEETIDSSAEVNKVIANDNIKTADVSLEADNQESMSKGKKTANKRKSPAKKTIVEKEKRIENISNIDIQFEPDANVGSNKEKILALHQEGKSNMAIAKSLGLGIGEVKLIIDLFENGK